MKERGKGMERNKLGRREEGRRGRGERESEKEGERMNEGKGEREGSELYMKGIEGRRRRGKGRRKL